MNPVRLFLVVSWVSIISLNCMRPAFAADPAIRWEIENRFRYFKKASDFRAIASVYDGLKNAGNPRPSALQLERALESEVIRGNFNGIAGDDRLDGWVASIFENTCARTTNHTHSNCKMENGDPYLAPVTANLILRADGIVADTCEWRIDDAVVDRVPCNKSATTKNIKYGSPHRLEVRPSVGAPQSTEILLKDVFLVSFGDSFSAGEGNPDKPVRLVRDSYNAYGNSSSAQKFPVRQDLNIAQENKAHFFRDLAAVWGNTQCHRSLYSQHTKAALQYALEHPHITITFLNYSCTGAEIYEGILNAWWARDDVAPGNYDDAPQLVKALRDLCSDSEPYKHTKWAIEGRSDEKYDSTTADFPKCNSFVRKEPDAILLSVGGNDVGFAKMIANSAVNVPMTGPLSKGRSWIYGLWRWAAGPQSYETGLRLANERISVRYKELDTMLLKYLSVPSERVILSAYPQVTFDENGRPCKAGNLGMDVHKILGMYDRQTSAKSQDFVAKFYRITERAAKERHWRFADQHIAQDGAPNNFANDALGIGHGLCAAGPEYSAEGDMRFSRPDEHATPPMHWTPVQPESWKPYSPRNRWIVTPNDSFMATNYHDAGMELVYDPVQPLYAATLSGSFHPNALGHAAIADSVLIKLREALPTYEE